MRHYLFRLLNGSASNFAILCKRRLHDPLVTPSLQSAKSAASPDLRRRGHAPREPPPPLAMQDLSGAAVAGAHLLSLVLMGASRKVFGPEVVAQRLVRHRHRHPRHHPLHKPPSLSFATASLTASLTATLAATLATTLVTLATLTATLATTLAATLATLAAETGEHGEESMARRSRAKQCGQPAWPGCGTAREYGAARVLPVADVRSARSPLGLSGLSWLTSPQAARTRSSCLGRAGPRSAACSSCASRLVQPSSGRRPGLARVSTLSSARVPQGRKESL